ncbi:hypothetical protein DCO48_04010 [Pseudomonas sp. SDI]|uniref:hypothetical protein n=1 Tax=Pseudomonas sp. SDI TaxID=2170734 RepID=UPI000DE7790E|nr:hypothetical protein [Pseudomonas sp. SDI]PWB35156.1 hypothetical protein DCO48_04010 [Pseudomonas sp. SDI]
MNPLVTLLCGLLLATAAEAGSRSWPGIRDGSLYLSAPRADSLQLSWVPAWQAEANQEQVFLLDGQGRLQAQRLIAAREVRGQLAWPLAPSTANYRVEIPGYSFRRYQLDYSDSTHALFAPAKVHFSLEVGAGTQLYFRVAAGEQAVLAGKNHGGVDGLHARRLEDGSEVRLTLAENPAYWKFEQVALPISPRDQIWQLDLHGRGKAAFWLDGSANLFAQRPEDLAPLRQEPGTVQLRSGSKVLGPTARLGTNLPYLTPPASSFAVLDALKPQAAGYYSFTDVLARKPQYEDAFRSLYQERFGIRHDITLLAATGRRADLRADTSSHEALAAWLDATVRLGGKGVHYLAFADEPNLNYRDYASFQQFFAQMLAQVRDYPGARAAGVRIALPASSRFVNGPLTGNSDSLRGLDWARHLLGEFGAEVDALAWHEWMVRDLLATRSYRDAVRQAAELVGRDAQGRPRKALLIDQTNLSSGSSLSLYEQNSQYAALWWASVAINASQDGLLDMLNWFHIADEPNYPKGMLRVLDGGERFELKPVGLAQQFIQQHWLDQVLQLDNDAFEVDALAMARDRQRSLLGVNKGERLQRVSLATPTLTCPQDAQALTLFGPDNQPRSARYDCKQGHYQFDVPGQTLFALRWTAP